MNMLQKAKKKFKEFKSEWVTPEEHSKVGSLTLTTPDGKTEVTIIIANSRDAKTAKQIANLLLTNENNDFDIGFTD